MGPNTSSTQHPPRTCLHHKQDHLPAAQGHDLHTAGLFAARAAAAVVAGRGAQLSEEDAAALVATLPTSVLLREHWPQQAMLQA